MKLFFKVLNSSLKDFNFTTNSDTVTVGRASDNDLPLKQPSISRHHAVIRQQDGNVILEDLGSKNATKVDGVECEKDTSLRSGAIISFGDVMVDLRIPDLEDVDLQEQEDEEVTPEAALLQTLDEESEIPAQKDIDPGSDSYNPGVGLGIDQQSVEVTGEQTGTFTEAPTLERVPEAGQGMEVSEKEGRLWAILSAVLGLTAAVIVSVFFLNYSGTESRPVSTIGVALRVGEVKIVEVPSGFVHNPQATPWDIVHIDRTLNLNMAVTVEARSQGTAAAEIMNRAGQKVALHINVLPRRPAERDLEPVPPEELARAAREKMIIAESLRLNGEKYEAKKIYEEIVDMPLSLVSGTSSLRSRAEQNRRRLEREIHEEHEEIMFRLNPLVRLGQYREALRKLENIMELIPDNKDIRHQHAEMLHRMLVSMLERER